MPPKISDGVLATIKIVPMAFVLLIDLYYLSTELTRPWLQMPVLVLVLLTFVTVGVGVRGVTDLYGISSFLARYPDVDTETNRTTGRVDGDLIKAAAILGRIVRVLFVGVVVVSVFLLASALLSLGSR